MYGVEVQVRGSAAGTAFNNTVPPKWSPRNLIDKISRETSLHGSGCAGCTEERALAERVCASVHDAGVGSVRCAVENDNRATFAGRPVESFK